MSGFDLINTYSSDALAQGILKPFVAFTHFLIPLPRSEPVAPNRPYVCMCVCMYICVYVCICIYVCMYVCVCMYICVYVCICMYVCMCVRVCVFTQKHTRPTYTCYTLYLSVCT